MVSLFHRLLKNRFFAPPTHRSTLIACFMNGHHLKLLKELSKDNKLSQRELSKKPGVSLGSVNYQPQGIRNVCCKEGIILAGLPIIWENIILFSRHHKGGTYGA